MERLTKSWFSSLALIALFPALLWAADVQIRFNEPAAPGNDCAYLTVYYCFGAECDAKSGGFRIEPSDADCGQLLRDLPSVRIKIPASRVPGIICIRVTTTNTAGNENAGATSCVTMS